MATRRTLAVVLAVAALGCTEEGAGLLVDLRTDLSPANEFVLVRTELSTARLTSIGGDADESEEALARSDADYVRGERVAELTGLRSGTFFLRVSLLDAMGNVIVSRVSTVDVRGRASALMVISRSCRGVVCPEPGGDPERSSCSQGMCVAPGCSPATPELCDDPCTTSADCTLDGTIACARALCAEGECFAVGDHSLCGSDEWCDPGVGCVLREGVIRDAGPGCPETEASCADGDDDDCDGLLDCADPDCTAQPCDDADPCTESDACTDTRRCAGTALDCDDANGCTTDGCDAGACTHVPSTDPCDDGFFCNGDDTCADGACSAHGTPPCASFCNETTRTCDQCFVDTDCGAPQAGTWSSCGGFATTCDEGGTRSRSVMTPRCTAGTCSVVTTTETEACARDTDDDSCGTTTYGSWGACGGFGSTCDEGGTQSRSVMRRQCTAGACGTRTSSESRACTRADRDGVMCGTTRMRCCNQSCRDTWADEANCAGCGLRCTAGLTCRVRPEGGGASCGLCSANAQCPPSGSTCYTSAIGGDDRCQCQADSHCARGQRCYTGSGNNYCYYP